MWPFKAESERGTGDCIIDLITLSEEKTAVEIQKANTKTFELLLILEDRITKLEKRVKKLEKK